MVVAAQRLVDNDYDDNVHKISHKIHTPLPRNPPQRPCRRAEFPLIWIKISLSHSVIAAFAVNGIHTSTAGFHLWLQSLLENERSWNAVQESSLSFKQFLGRKRVLCRRCDAIKLNAISVKPGFIHQLIIDTHRQNRIVAFSCARKIFKICWIHKRGLKLHSNSATVLPRSRSLDYYHWIGIKK